MQAIHTMRVVGRYNCHIEKALGKLEQAIQAIWKSGADLVTSLRQQAEAGNPTALGLPRQVESYKFLVLTALLSDKLPIFSLLSKAFQSKQLNFQEMTTMLQMTRSSLLTMPQDVRVLITYNSIFSLQSDADAKVEHDGIHVTESHRWWFAESNKGPVYQWTQQVLTDASQKKHWMASQCWTKCAIQWTWKFLLIMKSEHNVAKKTLGLNLPSNADQFLW